MSNFTANMHEIRFRLLQRSPRPIAGGEGASCPLPKTLPRPSALRASILRPPGYNDPPRFEGAGINTAYSHLRIFDD